MSEAEIVLFTGVSVSPCQMALNLCAAFTEFPFGSPERTQPLRAALEGAGRSHEPKLVWLLAHSGTRSDFEDLVYTLVDLKFLDQFYADDSALELLCWNLLERPSRALINHERMRRIEREKQEHEQHFTFSQFLGRSGE